MSALETTWVVYVHTCNINGKSYVGITSKNPVRRWGTDGRGYKGQAFYDAIQKYGWHNFTHTIIASGLSEEDAKKQEISLIEELGSHVSKKGYNVSLGGDGYLGADNHGEKNPMYGRHHSDETKSKISAMHKGRALRPGGWHHSEEDRKKMSEKRKSLPSSAYDYLRNIDRTEAVRKAKMVNSIPVCQYDLSLNLIKKYSSAMDAERETGINHSNIAACCKRKANIAGGYIWLYESDISLLDDLSGELLHSIVNKNKLLYGKKVLQFDLFLNLVAKFESIHEASKQTGVTRRGISDACNGTIKTSGGYVWRFEGDITDTDEFKRSFVLDKRKSGKHVVQLDDDMNIIGRFVSAADAARAVGIPRTCIGKVCRGKQHSAGGYIWRFVSDMDSGDA